MSALESLSDIEYPIIHHQKNDLLSASDDESSRKKRTAVKLSLTA